MLLATAREWIPNTSGGTTDLQAITERVVEARKRDKAGKYLRVVAFDPSLPQRLYGGVAILDVQDDSSTRGARNLLCGRGHRQIAIITADAELDPARLG